MKSNVLYYQLVIFKVLNGPSEYNISVRCDFLRASSQVITKDETCLIYENFPQEI